MMLGADWMQSIWMLTVGMRVPVRYREADGRLRELEISDPEPHDGYLDVWCWTTNRYEQLDPARLEPS